MTVSEFVAKWQKAALTERAAAQQHFLDLCDLLEHPKPAQADPTGEWFTFEKGAAKHGGGDGFADVWKRGFFGWEYKGKHKDLDAAYDQLLQYREALENPPLLVVCDMDRIVVHTNFTATVAEVHDIPLAELHQPRHLEILRAVFHSPDKLKPGITSEIITAEAASRLADIAQILRARGLDAHQVAHFLDRIVFCLFAEDIGLLPPNLFSRVVEKTRDSPSRFSKLISQLFDAMAQGGDFGLEVIRRFNGSLFVPGPVLELTQAEIESVHAAAQLEWSAVDPSIFGTLFERGMDPAKRAQLGAHYTSREDIETLVEPVVMQPLRREWQELRDAVESLV
ncbi:MAG: class I SAM-dependent DNA methyltransferase, partial [Planctomycetes bacterium]|nr:class I SAM-dependent DNA methyltransferase [Planctomycetota bacterium]